MANDQDNNLPKGDRWSVFDTISWITFGEVRQADGHFEFPKQEWSCDWESWPPEWLPCTLQELHTGIPWEPGLEDTGPLGVDGQRAWARRVVTANGGCAGQLLKALVSDIERYHAIQDEWGRAKLAVNAAIRRGQLRVWGIKAYAPSKPNYDGIHELLSPLLFTETRGVNEGGWVDWTPDGLGFIDYAGPSYDRVFFDSAEVQVIWPVRDVTKHELIQRAFEWMSSCGETYLRKRGQKPLKKALSSECIAAFRSEGVVLGVREAHAAYKRLPGRLRRGQGESET